MSKDDCRFVFGLVFIDLAGWNCGMGAIFTAKNSQKNSAWRYFTFRRFRVHN
ncbi:MAG: hypothetical protein HOL72_00310 [Euryarchaeota archaeon]|nr:hypothetical protein [Euryarchaeota archaeon]